VFYCSAECQREDWRAGCHKVTCGKAKKVPKATAVAVDNYFPFYDLKLDETNTFLVITVRGERQGTEPTGFDLIKRNLVQVEDDVHDESKFIRNVRIHYNNFKFDSACVGLAHIHREAVRILCGEDGVLALEAYRGMDDYTLMISGGLSREKSILKMTMLHVQVDNPNAAFPFFHLQLDEESHTILTITPRKGNKHDIVPCGNDLIKLKLVDVSNVRDHNKFIRKVKVYQEGSLSKVTRVVDVHRDAVRVMCGSEGVAALESNKRLSLLAFMTLVGGTPSLHR